MKVRGIYLHRKSLTSKNIFLKNDVFHFLLYPTFHRNRTLFPSSSFLLAGNQTWYPVAILDHSPWDDFENESHIWQSNKMKGKWVLVILSLECLPLDFLNMRHKLLYCWCHCLTSKLNPNEYTEIRVGQTEGVVGTTALRQEMLGIFRAQQGKCVWGISNRRENGKRWSEGWQGARQVEGLVAHWYFELLFRCGKPLEGFEKWTDLYFKRISV